VVREGIFRGRGAGDGYVCIREGKGKGRTQGGGKKKAELAGHSGVLGQAEGRWKSTLLAKEIHKGYSRAKRIGLEGPCWPRTSLGASALENAAEGTS